MTTRDFVKGLTAWDFLKNMKVIELPEPTNESREANKGQIRALFEIMRGPSEQLQAEPGPASTTKPKRFRRPPRKPKSTRKPKRK
ncbi:MAG TPA: hypothetical protein V6C81_11270 [Planktothrix sp.]